METKTKTFKDIFAHLSAMNVNQYTEKRDGLTYLSWSAMTEVLLKHYPDAEFRVTTYGDNAAPYFYDAQLGYMVHCTLTIEGYTREMYLPVMDKRNRAMKAEPYDVKTRNGSFVVEAATMFDINTAIMRCKVKAAAMFGLGLYIYNGEDLPTEEKAEAAKTQQAPKNKAKLTAIILANEAKAKQLYNFIKQSEAKAEQMLDPVNLLRQYYDFGDDLKDAIYQLYNNNKQ